MPENQKPHVVVIMADQLRFDFLTEKIAPNISQLRKESVDFTNAYCSSPLCVPARASFFTSTYPSKNSCLINGWSPQDASFARSKKELPNLYEMMQDDWDSWHTGKQHFFTEDYIEEKDDTKTKWKSLEKGYGDYRERLNVRPPGGAKFQGLMPEMVSGKATIPRKYSIPTIGKYEPGFDAFFDGYILKESLDALKNRDQEKPFLLNAMFLAPHPPLDIPDPFYSKFKEMDLPANVGQWAKGQSPLQMYNLTGHLGVRYSRDDWEKIWPVYAGLVNLLDECVGQIIQELKDQGMYENTMIVFTSDHGEMLGSHCLWQKMCMYEESAKVPLMLKLPGGIHAGKAFDQTVMHIDVLPTICDFVGLEKKNTFQGCSLKEIIEERKVKEEKPAFIQYDGNGALGNYQRAIVLKHKKLIVDMFKDEVFYELYDLSQDPQEQNNLAFEDADTVKRLLALLNDHMKINGDRLTIEGESYELFLKNYTDVVSARHVDL